MHSIQVSLDGPADIQNKQRPLANGNPSFERVCATLHAFEQSDVPHLLVKATISQHHVQDMPSITRFLCETFKVKRFHLGPVMNNGRSLETGYLQPEVDDFVHYAKEAQRIARMHNREVIVSLAQNTFPQIRLAFCGLTDPNFAVTVEGNVTSCYEVLYADDPRARSFHFGYYESETDSFVFDNTKIQAMRQRLLPTLTRCTNCFAKWQCGGDCHMRLFDEQTGEEMGLTKDFRCMVNRALVREELIKALEGHGGAIRIAPTLATDKGIR
jgi:radical SAM protein with 4Fe4S-binding SPASM domain